MSRNRNTADQLNLYAHEGLGVNVLGPGVRYGIWVQGCAQSCLGCIAANAWDMDAGISMSVEEMVDIIGNFYSKNPDMQGITISGGEPFLQYEQLSVLLAKIEKLSLNVICYTGYYYEDLMKWEGSLQLLSYIDILIDGPYIEAQNNNNLWRGSDNQRVLFLTDKFPDKMRQGILKSVARKIEITIKDNQYFLSGIPPAGFDFEKYLEG